MKCSQNLFSRVLKRTIPVVLMVLLHYALYAQSNLKVSINFNNEPVSNVLRAIEKQTGMNFVYNAEHIKGLSSVTLTATDLDLNRFLSTVLGNKLTWKFENKNIIILPRDQAASKKIVSGIIKDDLGEPLPGVSVYLRSNNKIGTYSDGNGKYELALPENTAGNAQIVISSIGYETILTTYDKLRNMKEVVIKLSAMELSDVVVTGIFKKSAESFTGAVSTISSQEIMQSGSRNLIQTLNNIDPTINIVSNNLYGSNPNHLPELQIRGNSSVPNISELQDETRVNINTPLIVLDGFETTLQKMYDLNENDVESITILKDASATAIYGSRGANGVIVITTKAPVMGKLRISYKGEANIETPDLTEYHVLNAADKLALEKRVGLYITPRAENQVPLTRYYNYLLSEVNRGVNTYWLSIPLRVGIGQKHNMRLEGGDKTFRYSVSAQLNNTQGVMKESFRKVFNGTINLSYYLNNVKFTNSLMLSIGNSQESPYGAFSSYVKMNPYWRAYDDNGNVLKTMGNNGTSDYYYRWGTLPTNPLYNATLNTFDKDNSFDVTNNFSIEWKPVTEITLRGRIGLYKSNSESDVFKPGDHTDFANYSEADLFRKGSYNYGVGKSNKYDVSLNLSYNKTIGKHLIYAAADYNLRETTNVNYGFAAEGFNNENFDFIAMALQYAASSKPTGSESKVRSIGFTSNFNYTYANKYYMDLSFRTDGSSQYGSDKRFAPFWSAGIGWNLHNESFIKNLDKINFLKIRGSVGTTGSQNFSAYQAISTYSYFTDDRYFNWIGSQLAALGNPDLQWQQKFTVNVGLEGKLLNNLLSFTFDYYNDKTTNLVSSISSPASNGFTSYIENVGIMRNKGYEFKLTGTIYKNQGKGILWNITIGGIHNKNRVVEISEALQAEQDKLEATKTTSPNIRYRPGYSTNTIWVVKSAGIDPSNGKEVYISKSGEPTYIWNAADIIAYGTTEPKLQGLINTLLKYGNFTLNASFGYKFGGYAYNTTLIDKVENANYSYNVDSRVYYGRWSQPGDIAAFKGLDVTTTTYKTSRFVQKENLFKHQNLTLQYELKNPKLKNIAKIDNIIFSASTSDLFYLSSIKAERGLSYPYSHLFNFGVNVTF